MNKQKLKYIKYFVGGLYYEGELLGVRFKSEQGDYVDADINEIRKCNLTDEQLEELVVKANREYLVDLIDNGPYLVSQEEINQGYRFRNVSHREEVVAECNYVIERLYDSLMESRELSNK